MGLRYIISNGFDRKTCNSIASYFYHRCRSKSLCSIHTNDSYCFGQIFECPCFRCGFGHRVEWGDFLEYCCRLRSLRSGRVPNCPQGSHWAQRQERLHPLDPCRWRRPWESCRTFVEQWCRHWGAIWKDERYCAFPSLYQGALWSCGAPPQTWSE